jgi:hypothetical protein
MNLHVGMLLFRQLTPARSHRPVRGPKIEGRRIEGRTKVRSSPYELPLWPEGEQVVVLARPMAADAYRRATSPREQRRIVEGLEEVPSPTSGPASCAYLAHHGVTDHFFIPALEEGLRQTHVMRQRAYKRAGDRGRTGDVQLGNPIEGED